MDLLTKIGDLLNNADFKSNPIISPAQLRKKKTKRKRRSIKTGYYKQMWIDSGWELCYVLYNEDHNIKFERNIYKFPYTYKGYTKNYIPDFYLPDKDVYVEIKGKEPNICQYKYAALPVDKLIILRQKEMQPYVKYVINKYGKDYWKILKDEPW